MKRKCILSAAMVAFSLACLSAEQNSELYYVQMDKIEVPRGLVNKLIQDKGATGWLVNSQIYIDVTRNGTPVWRSPALDVDKNGQQEKFVFDQKDRLTSFALVWKPGDEVSLSVKIAEKESLVRASTAAAGGAAGAAAGALAGGIGAGVFTGGLGAPAGALIGAAIGFVGGAGASQAVPVEGARLVASFAAPIEKFGLNGELVKDIESTDDLLLNGKAKLQMHGYKRTDVVAEGGLKLQKNYLVRLRSVKLSSTHKKFKEGADYYMEVGLLGEKKPLKIDLGKLTGDTEVPMESLLVLKNEGGESYVRIKRNKWGPDPVVFEARQGATQGTSWVFMHELRDDNGSQVVFDTFPTEK